MLELPHEYVDHWFHSPSSMERSGGIFLVRAGHNIAKPNYHVGPKFVMYHSVHFVVRGAVQLNYASHEEILHAGDVFCFYPYDTYEYGVHIDEDDEALPERGDYETFHPNMLEMYWMAFDGVQSETILRRIGLTRQRPFAKQVFTPTFARYLKSMADAWTTTDTSDLRLLGLTFLIFDELCKGNPDYAHPDSADVHWTDRALEYMNAHFMDGVSVADVAKAMGLHRSHFTKEFTTKMGTTPSNFLQKLKMEKAKEMLAETSYSITEIGLSLNFSDLYSFTRAYSNYYGVPPSRHRSR